MAKKCLVLIFILVYCINLFLPILSFAQVVEGSSFYNELSNWYSNISTKKQDDFENLKSAYNQMLENVDFKDWMNVEGNYYYLYLPVSINYPTGKRIGFYVFRTIEPDIYIRLQNNYQVSVNTVGNNYGCYFEYGFYPNGEKGVHTYESEKFPTNDLLSIAPMVVYNKSSFPCSTLEEYCSLIMTNANVKKSNYSGGLITTDEIVVSQGIGLPEEEPPFDDSGIDWSSLFHYYISTKKTTQEDVSIGEYNNKDYYMENNLIFWWDGFDGMLSNSGAANEDYTLHYHPNLQYTYIFTDVDGNTARLHSGWLGPLEYNTLHQQNLMFLADPNGDLSKVEPLYNILTAVVFNAKDFWIDTVIGDKTIQEFKEDNAIKDYINNKVEAIWDEQGYLDFELKVDVMIQKVDLEAESPVSNIWSDSFNVYFNIDNGLAIKPQDSYFTYVNDDFDIVFFPDGNVREVFIKNDNLETDITEDNRYIIKDKTTGDIVYEYVKEDDGKVIIKDSNGTNIFESSNDTDWDMVLDNLEASGFDITGITEDMYGSTEELLKDVTKTSNLFKEVWYWLPFNMLSFVNVCLVILIVIKLLEFLRG